MQQAMNTKTRQETVEKSTSDLVVSSDNTTKLSLIPSPVEGIFFTVNGLKIQNVDITAENFNEIFKAVLSFNRSAGWILGDTLDLADRTWGNKYTGSKYEQAAKETGMSVSTLRSIVCVCHAIPYEQRRPGLSFSHHREIRFATETVAEREAALDKAENEKLTVRDLRKELRKEQQVKAIAKEEAGETLLISPMLSDVVKDAPPAVAYPLRSEFLRYAAWFSLHMAKVPKDQGKQMVDDLLPFLRDAYHFLRLRLEEEPDRDYDLPYKIAFLEE